MAEPFIRVAVEDDAPRMLEIYAPYVSNTAISFEITVPTEEEFRGRVRDVLKMYPWLVCELDRRIIGYAYAHPYRVREAYLHSVELSIYVDPSYHRMGIGRRLYNALEEILARQNVYMLYVHVANSEHPDRYQNGESLNFHFKSGFRIIGEARGCACKFGRWYNLIQMEKAIPCVHDANAPLIPFPELDP